MATRTCIICGGPAGSGEHVFPASLGGRRTNRGIYCPEHDNAYSGLAGIIAEQLAIFNAQLGVIKDHDKEPVSVAVTDVDTGQEVVLSSAGSRFRHPQAYVSQDEQGQPIQHIAFASRKEANKWLEEQKAKRIEIALLGKGERRVRFMGTAHRQIKLGGDEEGLRAITYIVQTFFAQAFPDVARLPALDPLKAYTLNNVGKGFAWWDFTPPADLPSDAFPFGHRVIVPDTPEHVAIAAAWADPEATGSIAPQAESAPTATGQDTSADTTQAAQADDPAKGAWTDPPRRRKPR